MGEGAVLPDRDLPVRAEMVHESERTRVTRVFLSGRTVIRKEPLGPDPHAGCSMRWLSLSGCAGCWAWHRC